MKIVLPVIILVLVGGYLYFSRGNSPFPFGAPQAGNTPAASISPTPVPSSNAATLVTFTANGFDPQTITVSPGTRVTWTNQTGSTATVDSDDHPNHLKWPFLNLGRYNPGGTLSVVFQNIGTYTYHDHLHPQFKGSVIVK